MENWIALQPKRLPVLNVLKRQLMVRFRVLTKYFMFQVTEPSRTEDQSRPLLIAILSLITLTLVMLVTFVLMKIISNARQRLDLAKSTFLIIFTVVQLSALNQRASKSCRPYQVHHRRLSTINIQSLQIV